MQTIVIKKLLWLAFFSLPLLAFVANGTGPRAEAVTPQSAARSFPFPVKVTIYKSHPVQLASFFHVRTNPVKLRDDRPTDQEVKAYVEKQALNYGVNPKLALWIVKHESQFNPHAMGDGEASRGLWQISKIYHPEVPDAVAFNVASSTEWSLERIRSGKVNEWSSYRNCRVLYTNCPF